MKVAVFSLFFLYEKEKKKKKNPPTVVETEPKTGCLWCSVCVAILNQRGVRSGIPLLALSKILDECILSLYSLCRAWQLISGRYGAAATQDINKQHQAEK